MTGLMGNALDFIFGGLGLGPGQGHFVVFFGKILKLCINGHWLKPWLLMLEGGERGPYDRLASHQLEEIFLVTFSYRN